jgi:hypothetical protein
LLALSSSRWLAVLFPATVPTIMTFAEFAYNFHDDYDLYDVTPLPILDGHARLLIINPMRRQIPCLE